MIGKFIGALCGWSLGGPIGMFLGILIGHTFDSGLREQFAPNPAREKAQKVFFDVTFQIIGCLAKSDGRVNEQEIREARKMMQEMGLSSEQMISAMRQFNAGKDPNFNLALALDSFNTHFQGQWPLRKLFIEMLLVAAYADGKIQPQERQLLNDVAEELGYSQGKMVEIEKQFLAERHFFEYQQQHTSQDQSRFHQQHSRQTPPPQTSHIEQAYALLGVSKEASDASVKKAWRKQMSEHHPDKLASKGLPPDMMRMATEKAKAIQNAYHLIRESRQRHNAP